MGRPIEQLAEQLGVELKGKRPVVNGVQLGKQDLLGLAEYDAEVNPLLLTKEERRGLLEVEKWNRQMEARIVDGTASCSPRWFTEVKEQTPEVTVKSSPQRFVWRATRVEGKRRRMLTRLPEKHSDNFPVVTGRDTSQISHTVRLPSERFHLQEPLPNGDTRPIVPASILKAPPIEPLEVLDTQEILAAAVRRVSNKQLRALPDGVHFGPNGSFPASELIRRESGVLLEGVGKNETR